MMLRSFFLLFTVCLFYIFGGCSLVLAMDPMAEHYCKKLNHLSGRTLYSPDHFHYARDTFPALEDIPDLQGGLPFSYRVRRVLLNETLLLKKTDAEGNISWQHPLYDSPHGNPIPLTVVLTDETILENFSRANFLDPRKRLLSLEEVSILKQNPDVYVEQEEGAYFLYDPLEFNASLGESLVRISARQVNCFFTAHASSLEDYRSRIGRPQNTLSFRSELYSPIYGAIILDMEAVFDEEISNVPERVLYALNHKTNKIDVFVLTHFPPPFKTRYVRLDPYVDMASPQRPSPRPNISEPPPMAAADDEEDDDASDDVNSDDFVDVNSEDNTEEVPPPSTENEELSRSLPPAPQPLPEPEPLNLNPFNSIIRPPSIPGLFHFSHHLRPSDQQEKEESAYYTTLDNLRILLSSISPEERDRRERLLQEIEAVISRRTLQESTLFDCHLAISRKALAGKPEGRSIIKGTIQHQQGRLYSIEESWKRKWAPPETPEAFNQFLERCCRWLSEGSFSVSFPSRNKHVVVFDPDVPPSGNYVEKHSGGETFWEPYPPTPQKSYRVTYGLRLFFDADTAEELEGYLLREGTLPIHSLIIHYVEMTSQRQNALLKILRNSPALVHLQINGGAFKLGMLSEIREALDKSRSIVEVELSQNNFPEIHTPSQGLTETLRMFTRGLYALRRLTLSERYGVSIHCTLEDAFTPRSTLSGYLTLTDQNRDALWTLVEEGLHHGIDALFMEKVRRGRFYPLFRRDGLSKLIGALPQWMHVRHLRMIKGLEDVELPFEFFTCGLVGFQNLQTLDLSRTKIAPHEGGYGYLSVLIHNCRTLKTLVLAGSFSGPVDLKTLFPALEGLRLQLLDLSSNQIILEALDDYAPFAHLPPTLRTLRMSSGFKGQVPLYLIETLLKHTQVRHFDISESPFNRMETPDERGRYANFMQMIQDLRRPTLTLQIGYEYPLRDSPQQPRQSIPLYLEDANLEENGLSLTPYNIKLFLKFMFKNPQSVREINFQDLVLDDEQFQLVHSVLLNKFPYLERINMMKCFTSWEEFLRACKMIRTLRMLRVFDISENPFHLFSSYDEFRHQIRDLFQADPTLTKIIFTGKGGERIEWTQRLFIKEPTLGVRAAAATVSSEGIPSPQEVRGFFIHPVLSANVAFSGDMRFFGYTENLLFLRRIFIDNISLKSTGLPLLESLKALRHLHSLALRNCFEDMEAEHLTSFFETLGTLNLKRLDISGHVFHHDEYDSIVPFLTRSSTLEEIHLCVPRRENKVVKRGVIGTVVAGGAAVGGGVLVTALTGGVGTFPYIAAVSGSGVTGGGLSAASGYIANVLKANKRSEQSITALMPFATSKIRAVNGYNVKRKPKGLRATQDFLTQATGGKIEFRLFRELSS